MRALSTDRMLRVIELASRAPSVHNTQPWLWRIVDDSTVELYADRRRQLPVADPDGRNLVISCGAALHHAIEAAQAMGLKPSVDLEPVGSDRDFLARLRVSPSTPPEDAVTRIRALEQRSTDRRRFTSWPIAESLLNRLAEAASGWGAYGIPISDVTARFRVELLLDRARTIQAADSRFADEQQGWVEHSRADGVPSANAQPARSGRLAERPSRFITNTDAPIGRAMVESSDGLIAICTGHDDQRSWLESGQALSSLWLHATRDGLSIVPLSQVIEVPETRQGLHHEVFADMARPQLLIRVGWQEIARSTLPRTPRRPMAEVILP